MSRIGHIAEGVTLYLGDCREIMPTLPPVDAVVTDPPYGIGINKSNRLSVSRGHGGETWDAVPADISWLLPMGIPSIVWGGNYFDLPPTRAPLVWDKNNSGRDFADFEMAWTNLDMVARRIVCKVREGDPLRTAQRYGMIRFGSRVDVYLPAGVSPRVSVGDKTTAGESVLALLAPEAP